MVRRVRTYDELVGGKESHCCLFEALKYVSGGTLHAQLVRWEQEVSTTRSQQLVHEFVAHARAVLLVGLGFLLPLLLPLFFLLLTLLLLTLLLFLLLLLLLLLQMSCVLLLSSVSLSS